MSAAARTLGIPELLNIILEHAPARDLLLQQRVNKKWQATIQGSIPIQEKMFLRPKTTRSKGHVKETFLGSRIEWNPLLSNISTPPYHNTGRIHCCSFNSKHLDLDSRYIASWQEMLVSDPPSSTLYFGVCGNFTGFDAVSTSSGKSGVTMAHLVEVLKADRQKGTLGSAEYEASCVIEIRQSDVEDFTQAKGNKKVKGFRR